MILNGVDVLNVLTFSSEVTLKDLHGVTQGKKRISLRCGKVYFSNY